jgi:Tfp pilus assembly protein FimT
MKMNIKTPARIRRVASKYRGTWAILAAPALATFSASAAPRSMQGELAELLRSARPAALANGAVTFGR